MPLGFLTTLMSSGLPIWLPLEILRSALSGDGVPPQYYLTLGIVTLAIFGSTPPRRALVITGTMLPVVAAVVVCLVPTNVPLLLDACFLTGLIIFVALYGQSVQTGRLRSELLHTLAYAHPLTDILTA